MSVHRVAEAAAANFLTNSFDRNGRCESNEDLTFGIFAVHSGLKITQESHHSKLKTYIRRYGRYVKSVWKCQDSEGILCLYSIGMSMSM